MNMNPLIRFNRGAEGKEVKKIENHFHQNYWCIFNRIKIG